jgi:cytoskeletal protein RodZ
MASVSEQLREAREAQKLTVQQVAEITKIRTDHLRALEEGNFDVFSAPVYIKGFIRSYATILKLDVPRVMAELDAELGKTQKFSEPPPLSDQPKSVLDFVMLQLSKLDWQKGVILLGVLGCVVLLIVIVFVWKHQRASDPLKGLKPGVYQSTQHVSGETLPLPPPKR